MTMIFGIVPLICICWKLSRTTNSQDIPFLKKKYCAHFACMPKYEKKRVLTMHTKSQNRMSKKYYKNKWLFIWPSSEICCGRQWFPSTSRSQDILLNIWNDMFKCKRLDRVNCTGLNLVIPIRATRATGATRAIRAPRPTRAIKDTIVTGPTWSIRAMNGTRATRSTLASVGGECVAGGSVESWCHMLSENI